MIDIILWYPSNSELAESHYFSNLGQFTPTEARKFLQIIDMEDGTCLYPKVGFAKKGSDGDEFYSFKYWYFDINGALNIVFVMDAE